MDIRKEISRIKTEGYNEVNAEAKLCQDIVLWLIANSSLCKKCTIKGGVVMRNISKNARRATQDIDIDFIRYSLDESSIRRFILSLNGLMDISIRIIGPIEELKQQDYHGKRVYVEIIDKTGVGLKSKIDFGVHSKLSITQDSYCFDIGFDNEGASLLINTKEQMLTEKLRSILRFGHFSTRFKDIYDIYYLFNDVDEQKLNKCFDEYIFNDRGMRENNLSDILNRVKTTFSNIKYLEKLRTSKKNWIGVSNEIVTAEIISRIQNLQE